jgi:perosamine synthetase
MSGQPSFEARKGAVEPQAAEPTPTSGARPPPLPRAPVFDWPMAGASVAGMPCVGDLPSTRLVTSGRAALAAAIDQLDTSPGDIVLVPTYHCPTMVAPILVRGLRPVLYAIGPEGLPRLDLLAHSDVARAKALFVAHFFGLPRSLQAVRVWCDAHGINLIEDCAHSFFGMAGDRPVGTWGHLATASLSKFFPVREGGMLARAEGPLRPLALLRPGLKRHLQSLADVLEFASQHGRPRGLAPVLRTLFAAKRRWRGAPAAPAAQEDFMGQADARQMMLACDMGRVGEGPALAVKWILRHQALGTIVRQRQSNFDSLVQGLVGQDGARALFAVRPAACAPYVMPLWIDNPARADRLYATLRDNGVPVFRWDRLWPGLAQPAEDMGHRWSRQVLQLLCHQDLRPDDVNRMIVVTRRCLERA